MFLDTILEKNILPDWLIRIGMRFLLAKTLEREAKEGMEQAQIKKMRFLEELRRSPIALKTQAANEQHYEVPAEFFRMVLGKHLKYSSCLWEAGCSDLDQAERAMLELTAERARLKNGQDILELGCGWGSLSLYMAERFPMSDITAVSNSRTQREFIEREAKKRGFSNLTVITCDMNTFDIGRRFDRVVSVEMFEHMRNYEALLEKVSSWMKPGALLFVHIFCHRKYAYPYREEDPSDWIARYFFSGGIMPSEDLLLYFQKHVRIVDQWRVSGVHYQKTSEAWLANMDQAKSQVGEIFKAVYGSEAPKFWAYWRIFFMACAELFGYRKGGEWFVSHYLFEKRS